MEKMEKIQANPFQCGGAVRDSRKFVGRNTELREILSRVATMQSVSVCGPRRIGKSSLLRHISDTGRPRLDETYQFHYEDLQPLTSPEEFYGRVCAAFGDKEGEDYDDLRAVIDGKKIVLCLDEFEKTVEADFGADFFDKLRSLAQTGNLALILATKVPLDELYRRYQGPTSGFPNIFTKVMVGELPLDEARRLINQSDYFDQKEQAFILKLAGGHPYWLNFVCAQLYDAIQEARARGSVNIRDTSIRNEDQVVSVRTREGSVNLRDIEQLFRREFAIAASGKSAASNQRRSAVSSQQMAATASSSDPNAPVRLALFFSFVALAIGGFSAQASNPFGLFLAGGILLISLWLLVSAVIRPARR